MIVILFSRSGKICLYPHSGNIVHVLFNKTVQFYLKEWRRVQRSVLKSSLSVRRANHQSLKTNVLLVGKYVVLL